MAGYGAPYTCPKCVGRKFYGMLKRPGVKLRPCPNCGARLIRVVSTRRG